MLLMLEHIVHMQLRLTHMRKGAMHDHTFFETATCVIMSADFGYTWMTGR